LKIFKLVWWAKGEKKKRGRRPLDKKGEERNWGKKTLSPSSDAGKGFLTRKRKKEEREIRTAGGEKRGLLLEKKEKKRKTNVALQSPGGGKGEKVIKRKPFPSCCREGKKIYGPRGRKKKGVVFPPLMLPGGGGVCLLPIGRKEGASGEKARPSDSITLRRGEGTSAPGEGGGGKKKGKSPTSYDLAKGGKGTFTLIIEEKGEGQTLKGKGEDFPTNSFFKVGGRREEPCCHHTLKEGEEKTAGGGNHIFLTHTEGEGKKKKVSLKKVPSFSGKRKGKGPLGGKRGRKCSLYICIIVPCEGKGREK